MSSYRIERSGSLRGSCVVPGDKSIGHRGLIFAALASGPSRLRGLSSGLDNLATEAALRAMGVRIDRQGDQAEVFGVGLDGLSAPKGVLDCGNSGTTIRLLTGLLVGQPFATQLTGDASLSRRPMGRIVEPLRARGAHLEGAAGPRAGDVYPPLSITPLSPPERLLGLEYALPMASAQVKSALLLSGLYAAGPTRLSEPHLSRDHTERMLLALGAPIQTAGPMVALEPQASGWSRRWEGFDWSVPGDLSSAAFPLVATLMQPGSAVRVRGVGVNPSRTGLLDALRAMGARVGSMSKPLGAGDEPTADLEAHHAKLRAVSIGGELLVRMIDEVPAFCALAATVPGTTEIRDAQELRVKESDRLATMAEVLGAFGVPVEELPDGLRIEGAQPRRAADIRSRGDHRIAMSAALLALGAEGESWVRDVECVQTSFPGFASMLRGLGAQIEEVPE